MVFPFERKYSEARVINTYVLTSLTILFLGSLNSFFANDLYSSVIQIFAVAFMSISLLLNRLKLYNTAKFFLLILIAFILFFYNSYHGTKSGAYLFYFPLSLAIVNIYDFDNKREMIFILFHFLMNVFLISLNFYTNHTLFSPKFISPEAVQQFFIFNFALSTICIGYFIYLIVNMNIRQKRLINNLTAEMLKSEASEENKKTNTEILLAELQHRLKNNLSLMSSLLRLKMEGVKPENFERKITDASHAIQVVADANRFVIFYEGCLNVPMKIYFHEVVDSWLSFQTNKSKKAQFTLDIREHEINIKQAVPLALIIHELISLFCTQKESECETSYFRITIQTPGIVVINSSIPNLLELGEASEYLIQELIEQIDAALITLSINEFEIRCARAFNQKKIESETVFS